MALLRYTGILLLILALLPWGAFTGARFAGLVTVAAVVEDAALPQAATGVTPVEALRPCRSGILPGGCGPDARLDTALAVVPPGAGATTLAPDAPGV